MTGTPDPAVPEIGVYRHQAELVRKRVRSNLEGFSHVESLVQPEPAGHSANWILGHLIEVYQRTLDALHQERVLTDEALEPYRQGAAPREDPDAALPLEELLDAWDATAARVDAGLQGLAPEALDARGHYLAKRPEPTTLRQYLDTILFHQAYHAGQLGLSRRLAGKEGAVP